MMVASGCVSASAFSCNYYSGSLASLVFKSHSHARTYPVKQPPGVAIVSNRFLLFRGGMKWVCWGEKETSMQRHASKTRARPPPKRDPLQNWQSTGLTLSSVGFILGPLLDCIHSRVQLQIYDNGAIDFAGFHTNIVVPPLLAIFYGVVGLLQLALDKWIAPKEFIPRASLGRVIFSLICLVAILEVSAEMYEARIPYSTESYVLFALSELNWFLFDGTWWGFALAIVVGVSCPLAEIPIMKLYEVWHYPNPNVDILGKGLVTWVFVCYFAYTPFLANLSRWLSFQYQSAFKQSTD